MGRSLQSKYSYPYQTDPSTRKGKYYYWKPGNQPFVLNTAAGLTALATAAVTQVDTVFGTGSVPWELYQTTEQTLMPTFTATLGLEIGLDAVNNESVEYVIGGNNVLNPLGMLTTTNTGDPDFFMKAKFNFVDVSGSDQFLMGFRKVQTYAVPTSFITGGDPAYTDFFAVGFAHAVANPNVLMTCHQLNDGGATPYTANQCLTDHTNFTWADGLSHTLELRVINRKPKVLVNGIALGQAIAVDGDGNAITSQKTYTTNSVFQFDSGDTLVPFIFSRYDTTSPGAIYLQEIEIGHLRMVGKDQWREQNITI